MIDLQKNAVSIIIVCCLVIGLFSGVILTQYIQHNNIDIKIKNSFLFPQSKEGVNYDNIIHDFYFDNDIRGTLSCARNHLFNDYKYVITSDFVSLTFDELLEQGGDCKNWNDLWRNIGHDYYYDVEAVLIEGRDGEFHIFSIISNSEGYCLVDQMTVDCFLY